MISLALDNQLVDTPYRIVRAIGEGGMGRVYEATHARLAGRYAVKFLLKRLSHDPEAVAMFHREARITSSLQHPNIVQVIDFNATADGTEYLVMEHLQGESLAQRLRRERPLSREDAAGIVAQVAAGLMAAHTHGVVHRDLKPDNIFLVPVEGSARTWAKILDFGIALIRRPGASLGPERSLVGTPLYMSPEQLSEPSAAVDAATDQFALAAITYEMLTGAPPFDGSTLEAIVSQVLTGEPPPMGHDPGVEAVVRQGLAKSPQQRYPSVIAYSAALRAAVTKATRQRVQIPVQATARKPPAIERRPRWRAPRGSVSIVFGAAAASAAISFLAGQAMSRRAGRRAPAVEAGAPSKIGVPLAIADGPPPAASVVHAAGPDRAPPDLSHDERPSALDPADRDSPPTSPPSRRYAPRTSPAPTPRQSPRTGVDQRGVFELSAGPASHTSPAAWPSEPPPLQREPPHPRLDDDEPMPPSDGAATF